MEAQGKAPKAAKPVVARTSARIEGDRAALGVAWEALVEATTAMTAALAAEEGPPTCTGVTTARTRAGALLSAYFYEVESSPCFTANSSLSCR